MQIYFFENIITMRNMLFAYQEVFHDEIFFEN